MSDQSRLTRLISTLQDLAILVIARPLRKKAVLFVILAISVIYCILSLAHIHLANNSRHPRVLSKGNGLEYDIDSRENKVPKVHSPSSSLSPISSQQFAFLKRQHQLKESLEDAKQKSRHLPRLHDGHRDQAEESIEGGSTSDLLGGTGGGVKCRNSVQGKHFITDDRGYVCPRKLAGINGCCGTSSPTDAVQLYSCETCNKNGCCVEYEYCISCCMSPSNRKLLDRLVSENRESPVFKIFFASITDYFELCLTKCRTSSASVQHENTYRNPATKHCYGDSVND